MVLYFIYRYVKYVEMSNPRQASVVIGMQQGHENEEIELVVFRMAPVAAAYRPANVFANGWQATCNSVLEILPPSAYGACQQNNGFAFPEDKCRIEGTLPALSWSFSMLSFSKGNDSGIVKQSTKTALGTRNSARGQRNAWPGYAVFSPGQLSIFGCAAGS